MLRLYLLIASVVTGAVAAGRTAENCEIGDQWTENYIRFECYEGEGVVVQGVRAVGCVPSNTEDGSMINPGATFNEQYFTYNCTQNGDVVSYQIKNCRDSTGKSLLVGQSSKAADGTIYRCYKDDKGDVKLAVGGSCIHKGKIREVGEKWTEAEVLKDKNQIVGKGILIVCTGDSKKGFYMQAYGCVTSSGASLANGGFAAVGKLFVQCLVASKAAKPPTTVVLKVVEEKVVTCTLNGTRVQSNGQYTTPAGDVYRCQLAVIKKIGCAYQGKVYKIGIALIHGKVRVCSAAVSGMFSTDVLGCKLPSGEIKPFSSTWQNGTEAYECKFTLKYTALTPYIAVGCSHLGKPVAKYVIVGKGADLKKCALRVDKTGYEMRDLSPAEVAAYYKAKSASESVYGGVGGSGSGGELTAQPIAVTAPSKDGGRPVDACVAKCSSMCALA